MAKSFLRVYCCECGHGFDAEVKTIEVEGVEVQTMATPCHWCGHTLAHDINHDDYFEYRVVS